MDKMQELLDSMKDNFKKLMKFSESKEVKKLGSFTCVDGTIITSPDDVLAVGSLLTKVDIDGNEVPLEDGNYTLDSGIVISVVNGSVAELSTVEEESTEVEVDPSMLAADPNAQTDGNPDLTKRLDDLEAKFKELSSKVEGMTKMSADQNEFNSIVEEKIKEFSALPDEKPKKASVKSWEEMDSLERFRANRKV